MNPPQLLCAARATWMVRRIVGTMRVRCSFDSVRRISRFRQLGSFPLPIRCPGPAPGAAHIIAPIVRHAVKSPAVGADRVVNARSICVGYVHARSDRASSCPMTPAQPLPRDEVPAQFSGESASGGGREGGVRNAFFRKERAKVQSQVHTLVACEKRPHGRSCAARIGCRMHERAALGGNGGEMVVARRTPAEGVRRCRRDHGSI